MPTFNDDMTRRDVALDGAQPDNAPDAESDTEHVDSRVVDEPASTAADAAGTVAQPGADVPGDAGDGGKAKPGVDWGKISESFKLPQAPDYVDSYSGVIDRLEEARAMHPDLSKEDIEKLRRKHRVQRITSAIADAGSAIANLVGTHHYAPDMSIDPRESMSAKTQARWDKEKAEREKIAQQNLEFAMKLGQARDAQQKGRMSYHDMLLKRQEANRKAMMWPYEARQAEAKADYWDSQAGIKRTQEEWEPKVQAKKVEKLDSEAKKNNSAAAKNDRTPAGGGKSGGGKSGGGKDKSVTVTETKTDKHGGKKTTVSRRMSTKEYEKEKNKAVNQWSAGG